MEKPPGARRLLPFIVRELGAYALHEVLGARGRRARPAGSDGRTVVLIHGHGSTAGAFHLLERALHRAGHRRFAAHEYATRGSVEKLAADLARWAGRTLHGDVHVVAHSLGGILARLWLQDHGGRRRVRSLTTLSTPHQGMARLPGARLLPIVRELLVGSELMSRLEASAPVLAGLSCLSVISTRDHFIRPWENAAFGAARVVPVDDAGHVGVLFSRRVHALVAAHLGEHLGEHLLEHPPVHL